MLFSIIMPSFNQCKFISESIDSVMCQKGPLELIVVDGGSKDGTIELLENYANKFEKFYFISEPDKGQADAVNKGVMLTKGDIIGWLNSDDLYLKGAIDTARQMFKKIPDADIVFGDEILIDQEGMPFCECPRVSFRYQYLYWYTFNIGNHASFFRKSLYEQCGGLNCKYRLKLDYDFFLRLCRDRKIVHVSRYIGAWRRHSDTITSQARPEAHKKELCSIKQTFGVYKYPMWFCRCLSWRERIIHYFKLLCDRRFGYLFSNFLSRLSHLTGIKIFDNYRKYRCTRLRHLLPSEFQKKSG